MMSVVPQEPWLMEIMEGIDAICKRIDDIIERDEKKRKECKKRYEHENRLAQEAILNEELTKQLAELNKRSMEMDKVCDTFKSRLTIAESDKTRLENAKEHYQIGKELTGVRFDFTAPPNIAKGYIKNTTRRLLQPFEMEADSEALWDQLRTAFPNPLEKEDVPEIK